ncbi:MAG: radical SAM protein [Pseudomonadota bacterium]
MSWNLKIRLRERLASEDGAIVKDWGGKRSVALVYPNTYAVGMGNLAVHTLYGMLNEREEIACERAFLPSKAEIAEHRRTDTPILALESQRPLAEFDAIAFSISFENDYLNLLPILDLARIPHRAADRKEDSPLLIAGGAAPTLNPAATSLIFDAIVCGEAESYADDLVPLLASGLPKAEMLAELNRMDGIFVPSVSKETKVKRRHLKNLDAWRTQTVIHSREAEFSGMHLIEIARGCPFGCAFCATPGLYRPARHRGFDCVMSMVDEGLKFRKKFGLIGAHILSHPDFVEIARAIHARGATFSPSSVRAADIDDERAGLLAESGHRSVSLGIEAGSEKLRDAIGKGLPDERLIEAVATLARRGIARIRLYFMIGFPNETEADIEAIARLSLKISATIAAHAPKAARAASVDLTISPFVPKPGTALAGARFAGEAALKSKINIVKRLLAKERGLSVGADAPLSSAIEAYLSQCGIDAVEFLEEAFATGNVRKALAKFT